MGILNDIWNTLFGKSNEQKEFGRGGSIDEPVMNIVHKKIKQKKKLEVTNPKVFNEVQQSITPNSLKELTTPKSKKTKIKSVVGQKTLNEIKEYLVTYGSLDVLTCEQKFKVKSLHNFIWFLRNEGFKIKTDKVGLHNELGQKVEVTNYRLITKK